MHNHAAPWMPVMHSTQELEALKRAQLQALCKQYGLKANGKNTELIERIVAHEQQLQVPLPHSEQSPKPSNVVSHNRKQPPQQATVHEEKIISEPNDGAGISEAAASEQAMDVMEVDAQSYLSPQVTPDLPSASSDSESIARAEEPSVHANEDAEAASGGVVSTVLDRYEQSDMKDVYDALAAAPQLETATELALVVDAPPEVQALERADLSEVYELASAPCPNAAATTPRSSTTTCTPPASSGLYPTINVQQSLNTKLTFKWDSPAQSAVDAPAEDNGQTAPGSPCAEKVSRKSAELMKKSVKDDTLEMAEPTGAEQRSGHKENACASVIKQPAASIRPQTEKASAAGANKVRPASAPGFVPRVATLAKKPDGKPAFSPRQPAVSATTSRKFPSSVSKPATTAPPSALRVPSANVPPQHRPLKRKTTDDPEADQPPAHPTDLHVAKRLKALAPSASATAAINRPGSATKVGVGVKKSPGKPVFDLQASLKRKLNYVPKKGPLDKPVPVAGTSGASGHAAGSGLSKKMS